MIPSLIMPFPMVRRIDLYRATLRLDIPTKDADFRPDQCHPPPYGWSGDEPGSSNPRQGRLGNAGGQAASGETSTTSSPTLIRDGGGEQAAGAKQLLVLEGVDEDAEDADATMRAELILLARDSPIWMAELRKYLQQEEKEKKDVQKEREVRLAHWREGIITRPT